MSGRIWTEAELATLRQRLAEGVTHRAIAKELGRTKSSVNHKAWDLGLTRQAGPRQPWTRQELDRLEQIIASGATYQQAADKLGRSRISVRGKAADMGLCNPERVGAFRRKDAALVAEIHDILGDCIDFKGMNCLECTAYLNAIGYEVSNSWVHKQIGVLGPNYRRWARENAKRRRSLIMSMRRRAAA